MWPQHLFSIRESAGWSRNPMSVFTVGKIKGHFLFVWAHLLSQHFSADFLVPCLGKFALKNCCCLFQGEFLGCLFCRGRWGSLELTWPLLNWYALVGEHIVVTIREKVIVAWWYLPESCTGCGNSDRMRRRSSNVAEFQGNKCSFLLLLLPKYSKAQRAIETNLLIR